jgi:hypothetical protein
LLLIALFASYTRHIEVGNDINAKLVTPFALVQFCLDLILPAVLVSDSSAKDQIALLWESLALTFSRLRRACGVRAAFLQIMIASNLQTLTLPGYTCGLTVFAAKLAAERSVVVTMLVTHWMKTFEKATEEAKRCVADVEWMKGELQCVLPQSSCADREDAILFSSD